MNKTKIEWCDSTWNPVTGCRHTCEYCYARRIACRFGKTDSSIIDGVDVKPVYNNGAMLLELNKYVGNPYPWLFTPTFHKYKLDEMKNKKGQNVFVCSMADLFGEWVPDKWIEAVFDACRKAPQHRYLFLTKNYIRASEFRYEKNWWIGRTITHDEPVNNKNKNLYLCYGVPKAVEPEWKDHPNTFISIEPIHGFIPDLPFYAHEYGYKWVIVGAETGNRKDKVIPKREWIEKIVEDCAFRKIPVFMKDSLVPIVGEENMLREFPDGLRK